MNKEERKEKIAELRKYHEGILGTIKDAYFACKHAHYPDHGEEKVIGLFESEVSKGDSVFIEFTTMDYVPADNSRRLYKWLHNPNYKTAYKFNEKTKQYLIPTSELHVVPTSEEIIKETHTSTVSWNPEKMKLDLTPAPVFEKLKELNTHYKQEVYKSKDGVEHSITFKDGVPDTYLQSKEGKAIQLNGYQAKEAAEFFKQLKY